jgi:hypothetical protein
MFTQADRAQLAELGISTEEVARQQRLFVDPPPATVLDRPCTIGDGITVLGDADRQAAFQAHARAAAAGRLLKFLPASGAATRMFQALLVARESDPSVSRSALERCAAAGDEAAREVLAFADHLSRFAFAHELATVVARQGHDLASLLARGDVGPVLSALLDPDGLDYARLPKGLLLFHRYADGNRTAFEEHLLEAAAYGSSSAAVRLHLTVSPEHEAAFRSLLERIRERCERRAGARFAIDFSEQKRCSDTLAVEVDNQPFRTADGQLLFRPGGHGALIDNLNGLRGDVVLLKTIDNIQPDHLRGSAVDWLRLLAGHLIRIQDALFAQLARLSARPVPAGAVDAARQFARDQLGATLATDADAAAVIEALDRPLRVCGMVRNTGEPGGGPFWVRAPDGRCTRQIVEAAQIDARDGAQRALFAAATHFNPVMIVCGLRDWTGRPFDLHAFVDPAAVFIARKSSHGRELKALERPGLWNGAMAYWHTLFVEVPESTFTPVKTVNDLLRPAHQPPPAASALDSPGAVHGD